MSTKAIGILQSRPKHFINVLSDKKLGKKVPLKDFTLNIRNISITCHTEI